MSAGSPGAGVDHTEPISAAAVRIPPAPRDLAVARGRLLAGVGRIVLLTVIAAVTYGVAPLYSSNQNQYFLHGLARAGLGLLSEDWLARTADPTPVFSLMVAATARYEAAFYGYQLVLVGVYFVSLIALTAPLFGLRESRGKFVLYLVTLLAIHSALLSRLSLSMGGLDLRTVFTSGVAGQDILGTILQPSMFGVLLMASIALFVEGRELAATACAVTAAVVHPTYLLAAAVLVASYTLIIARDDAGGWRAAWPITVVGVALAAPVVIYLYAAFRRTSPEAWRTMQDVLINIRLPHHMLIDRWLGLSASLQLGLIVAGLALSRRCPRLVRVLAGSLAAAAALTALQGLTRQADLALLMPWRISVYLVPVASSLVAAAGAAALWDRVVGRAAAVQRLAVWAASAGIVLLGAAGGLIIRSDLQAFAGDRSMPVMGFVRSTKAAGDVYLIPLTLERFRLETGAPVFVDRKSIPYRDVEVVEWYQRFIVARDLYLTRDADLACAAVGSLARRYPITHVVLMKEQTGRPCPVLQRLYEDADYGVYRVIRG